MNGWSSKVGKGQAVTASRKWLVKAALSVHYLIILPSFPNILHSLLGTYRKATRRKDDTERRRGTVRKTTLSFSKDANAA